VSSYHLYPCVLMYLCILVSSYHLYQVSSKSNLSWQRINKLSKSWRETTMVADPVNPSSPLTFGDWPSQPIITADLWWLTQSTHYHRWPLVTSELKDFHFKSPILDIHNLSAIPNTLEWPATTFNSLHSKAVMSNTKVTLKMCSCTPHWLLSWTHIFLMQ